MPHRPVGAEDHIVRAEGCTNTHRNRLLPLILVQRAGNCSLQEEGVKLILETADQDHAPVHLAGSILWQSDMLLHWLPS
jgi:hypothetical protein